jgi:ABC-type phosphate transport system substrate-binding protein
MEFIADQELQPVIDSLVAGFNAENASAKVSVKYLPATEALDAMLQRKSRLVIIGRPLTSKEHSTLASQQVELIDFDMALNSVACIASVASKKAALPFEELRDNVIGTEPSYTQVLGSYLSSTEALLDSIFHADSATLKGKVVRYSSVDSIINHVKNAPSAIGYLSSAWLKQVRADSSLRVLDIIMEDSASVGGVKSVMLHPAYVFQGKYPLVSRIMGYTLEPTNTLPRGFLAYAMSANGQRVFLNYELVPRTQIIRLVPPKQ